MNQLSVKAEELLKEILEHRDDKGNCDSGYWKKRFELLSVAEDVILRSLFKELIETEMIFAKWADNYPYIIFALANGISYFEEKEMNKLEKSNSFVNNFYSEVSGIQIQQGTINSSQEQTNKYSLNVDRINELIELIKRYDSVLDADYGTENANQIRKASDELSSVVNEHHDPSKARRILDFIRDLSVNAGGGLIAAGVLQLIKMIMG